MNRLSKYVKEKIVKVLVAALVVGTVAGNGTLTVQAEEAATVVGEESVSGGDAVVKENVVADPEVTPEATTMVTPEEAAGAGLIIPFVDVKDTALHSSHTGLDRIRQRRMHCYHIRIRCL